MPTTITRRTAILAPIASAAVGTSCASTPNDEIAALEGGSPGRIGLYAASLDGTRVLAHRADERFAMCSSFKAPLAGFVLDDVAQGRLRADQPVAIDQADLISYSPVVERSRERGQTYLSVLGLCRAAVEISDNTAANLLLELIGGPAGFTARAQKLTQDGSVRLDRIEPALNENRPGDPRDTATPRGSVKLLSAMLYGDGIAPSAQQAVRAMMIDCSTGLRRLRAGLPKSMRVGDKTGTSLNGLFADTAFVMREDQPDIVIAAYVDDPRLADKFAVGSARHAELGKMIARHFAL